MGLLKVKQELCDWTDWFETLQAVNASVQVRTAAQRRAIDMFAALTGGAGCWRAESAVAL